MKQFIPSDGIYVYFRYDNAKTVMVVTNNNNESKNVATERFAEVIGSKTSGQEITTQQKFNLKNGISIPGKTVYILEIQ